MAKLELKRTVLLFQHFAAELIGAHGAFLHLAYTVCYFLLLTLNVVFNVLVLVLADEYLAFQFVKLSLHLVKLCHPDGYFKLFALFRKLYELLCLLRLYTQLFYSAFKLGEYIRQTKQVFLCGCELSLSFKLLVSEL